MPKNDTSDTFLKIALFLSPILFLRWRNNTKENLKKSESEKTIAQLLVDDGHIYPPLPDIVRELLSACRLAYLSTVDVAAASSHLSLMRFTYVQELELIVMSTNRYTKKFDILQKQKGVALLVHDFGQNSDGSTGNYSITLNGDCYIASGEDAEKYRAAHLKHNPDYPQFIVGDDIAILCVRVSSARICNISDQVQKWNL